MLRACNWQFVALSTYSMKTHKNLTNIIKLIILINILKTI